jgi:superfamily I DNA/RNA helicase
MWTSRRERLGLTEPVRVLVLTYNRTLKGYIDELSHQQVTGNEDLELEVETFGKWALGLLEDEIKILDKAKGDGLLWPLVRPLPANDGFMIDEVDYVLGRFAPDNLDAYLLASRDGRGRSPRIAMPLRRRLIDEVIAPYQAEKQRRGVMDWNDIAVAAGESAGNQPWDVVIVDEAQDFSANQVRTIGQHLAEDHSITFVMDAAQRIYPRFFAWKEAGVDLAGRVHPLKRNHRNTRQIAAFARPLVEGLPLDDDSALPDFSACDKDGPAPLLVSGTYGAQITYMLDHLVATVDFERESIAFLQPRGSAWFHYLRSKLDERGIVYAELTRASTWPSGPEAVAVCTIHSAKGLEFDHVVMPGLNQEVTPHGAEEGDGQLDALRRLVAMGIGRARTSLMLGFKPDDPSTIVDFLKPETYRLVTL